MLFVAILTLTTFSIAGSAAFFSVYGLANMFAGYFWSVVFMGTALEAGKLVAASFLYRYWNKTSLLLKTYLFLAVFVLMIITSTGVFGYLSAGYQSDSAPLKQSQQQISLLEVEYQKLSNRKVEIDNQISQLKTDDVIGRQRLMKTFGIELSTINKRLPELDKKLFDLKQSNLEIEAHIGPIVYIAKAFGLSTDDAIKYIVLMLIVVFDPLAVVLTICVNIAIANIKQPEQPDTILTDNATEIDDVIPVEQIIDQPIVDIVDPIVEDNVVEPIVEVVEPISVADQTVESIIDQSVSDQQLDNVVEINQSEIIEPPQEVPVKSVDVFDNMVERLGGGSIEQPLDSILDQYLKRRNQS